MRKQVRNNPVLAGIFGQAGLHPVRPGAREVLGERRIVDAVDGVVGLALGADLGGALGLECLADTFHARG